MAKTIFYGYRKFTKHWLPWHIGLCKRKELSLWSLYAYTC